MRRRVRVGAVGPVRVPAALSHHATATAERGAAGNGATSSEPRIACTSVDGDGMKWEASNCEYGESAEAKSKVVQVTDHVEV